MAGTQAVDRTAGLLLHVLGSGRPVAFGELVATSGLAKSTTSRLLTALELQGLLRRDRAGAFMPGSAIERYARSRDHATALAESLRHHLARVVDRTGESANLAVVHRGSVEVVQQVDGTFLLGTVDWVGRTVAPHASALGRVFLAEGLLRAADGPLTALTPNTVTDPTELRRELDRIRRNGYAVVRDELEIGLTAVAVPVREDGEVVAAVSVSGSTARFDDERTGMVAAVLREEFPSPRAASRTTRGAA